MCTVMGGGLQVKGGEEGNLRTGEGRGGLQVKGGEHLKVRIGDVVCCAMVCMNEGRSIQAVSLVFSPIPLADQLHFQICVPPLPSPPFLTAGVRPPRLRAGQLHQLCGNAQEEASGDGCSTRYCCTRYCCTRCCTR